MPVAVAADDTDLVQLDEHDDVYNQEVVPITLSEQFLEVGIEGPIGGSPDGGEPPPHLLNNHSRGRPLAERRARREEVFLDAHLVTHYVRGPNTQPYEEMRRISTRYT